MVGHSSVPLGVALVLLGCYAGNLVVAQKGAQHPQPSFPAYPPPQDRQPPKAPSWMAYPPPQDPQPPKAPEHPPPQYQQPPKAPEHLPPQYQQPQQAPPQYQQPPKAPEHPPPQYQQPPKAPGHPPPQYQQPQQAPPQYQQPPKAPGHPPPQYQQPPKAPPQYQQPQQATGHPPPQYQQPQQAPPQYQQPQKAPGHPPPQYQQPPKAPPQYQQPPKAPERPPPQYQQPQQAPPQYQQPPKAPERPPPQYQQPPKAPERPPPQYQQPPKAPPQYQQPQQAPEYPKQPSWPAQRPPMKPSQVQFDAAGKGQNLQNPGQEMSPHPKSCEVDIPLRVPCGGPGISPAACKEIHCCSDINGCYYGKAVTVQCTKDASFIVVAARDATLPNIDLESISLMSSEPGCTHVDFNSLFAIYHFPVTSCGSVVMEVQGSIIYENRLFSAYEVGVGPLGSITRDSYYEVRFRCIYRGVSVVTLMTETMNLAGPIAIAPVIGPIQVELRLGNGVCTTKGCDAVDVAYDSYYLDSDYPVAKLLRDTIYIEVCLLNMIDPRLILILGRCWTTTQPNPHSMPQWDILTDGCPNQGDRYLSTLIPIGPSSGLPFPSHYKRFTFQMFTFVDQDMSPLREQIYIHCSTEVCTPGQGEQCDSSCGGRKKKRDIATTAVAREPRMVMTVGPLLMGQVEEAHQVP